MKKKLKSNSPSNAAACAPSYEGLGVWQIQTIRWEDDDRQKGKEWNVTIVCKDIEVVWKLIESDRNDIRTEIRAINHIAHACAVIPFIRENKEDQERKSPASDGSKN